MPRWLKITLTLLVCGTLFYLTHVRYELRPNDVRTFIQSFGIWGPLLFVFLYSFAPLAFLPMSILSIGAGLAFGVWPGALYIWFGALGGATTGYLMGRFFGHSVLDVGRYRWAEQLFEQMGQRGFLYVFILRLIPLVSFDLLSYAGGIARVRYRAFLLATALGMIPGIFAYTFLGASLASGSVMTLIVASIVFLTLLLLTYVLREPIKRWLGLSS